MRHALGFVVPAAATAAADTFAQQVALAAIAGLFGVLGVVLATYVGDELRDRRRARRELLRRIRPRKSDAPSRVEDE